MARGEEEDAITASAKKENKKEKGTKLSPKQFLMNRTFMGIKASRGGSHTSNGSNGYCVS